MAKYVIREVAVDPPVPPDLVVFRRADIERFVTAARRRIEDLTAELAAERERQVIVDLTYRLPEPQQEPEPVSERWIYKREPEPPAPWIAAPRTDDNVKFFEALRAADSLLIAGNE